MGEMYSYRELYCGIPAGFVFLAYCGRARVRRKSGKSLMDIVAAKKLLANQSKAELIKIIARLSSYDDDTESWLLEYYRKRGSICE